MTIPLEALQAVVGPRGWISDPQELAPHVSEWRGAVFGRTPLLVAPQSTAEVVEIVRLCADSGVGIVPQGGNTGMCAGAVPDESGGQIILSLHRMNRIRAVDADNFSMEVEAGCILENVQKAAREAQRYFPLSLGAEGSCQIGGNLATNAGGINVLRYGTARAFVLGLEVVLANGEVLNGLRALRKDTAGYDLKQLFIGSEGTLGIITAATLRLLPEPQARSTALVALREPGDAVRLLGLLRARLEDRIEAFELVSGRVFGLVEQHIPNARLPFATEHEWYVLLDATTQDAESLQEALLGAMETVGVEDAVMAKNDAEAEGLWRLRHSISEAERQDGKALKHDVAVPLSRMQEFLRRGEELVLGLRPDARLVIFGHVGDGNLHYNVVLPRDLPVDVWQAEGARVTSALYDLVAELGGTFSAEHGIGSVKRRYLERYRGGAEYALMRQLKAVLDPGNILNPGKVI